MINWVGELYRGYEFEGYIFNLSSLLYGMWIKFFYIGFVSFWGLKYMIYDCFCGNFLYEWGSLKLRMFKEGLRLFCYLKIFFKLFMCWSWKFFFLSSIL